MTFWHWVQHHVTTGNVAFVLTLILGAWEFTKWRLEGALVRVNLIAGRSEGHVLGHDVKSWKHLAEASKDQGGWYREVAIVEVENPGRTAVTCSDIGLDLGRVHWWQRWRHTVTPSYLPCNDAKTEGTVRLEPLDRAFFMIDIWQVLQPVNHHSFKLQDRPIRLRGSVRAAGRRKRSRSPWRKKWKVKKGQVSFLGPTIEPGLLMHQAASRWIGEDDSLKFPLIVGMALEARTLFPLDGAAPSHQQVMELIERHTHIEEPSPMKPVWALDISRDLAYHYPPTPPAPAPPTVTTPIVVPTAEPEAESPSTPASPPAG